MYTFPVQQLSSSFFKGATKACNLLWQGRHVAIITGLSVFALCYVIFTRIINNQEIRHQKKVNNLEQGIDALGYGMNTLTTQLIQTQPQLDSSRINDLSDIPNTSQTTDERQQSFLTLPALQQRFSFSSPMTRNGGSSVNGTQQFSLRFDDTPWKKKIADSQENARKVIQGFKELYRTLESQLSESFQGEVQEKWGNLYTLAQSIDTSPHPTLELDDSSMEDVD